MITLDFETRSFAELSGKKGVGTWAYSTDPTTTVLCMAYKIDDGPTQIWAPWDGDLDQLRRLERGSDARIDYSVDVCDYRTCFPIPFRVRVESGDLLVAHNSFFERAIWENILVPAGWPLPRPEQWVCTMATARANGLPASLDMAVKTLGLPVQKGDQKYMRRMMKPRAAWKRNGKGDIWFGTEEDYKGLCDYCILDVDVEYQLYEALVKLTPRERKIWQLDQEINHRGIGIDRKLAEGAWRVFSDRRDEMAGRLLEITDGAVEKPTQTAKIVKWANSIQRDQVLEGVWNPPGDFLLADERQAGHREAKQKLADARSGAVTPDHVIKHTPLMANCTAETVANLLSRDDIDQRIRDVLNIRSAVGGAAALKYDSFLRHATMDDRVRGELQYWGAHTGRWTSAGVQLHNAVKNKMDVDEAEQFIPCFYEPTTDRILASLRERGLPADKLDDLIATLVRSVIVADPGTVFVDFDYAAIEARVVAWLAGEESLVDAFRRGVPVYEQMAADIFGVTLDAVTKDMRALGKVAILGLGYGMGTEKFYDTCISWGVKVITPKLAHRARTIYRSKYSKIKQYWDDFEDHIKQAIIYGKRIEVGSKTIMYDRARRVLSYTLPNGRWLNYHKCRIEDDSIRYFGRLPPPGSGYGDVYSWGGKFTENEDQALSRDYMALAMRRVDRIQGVEVLLTVHDEILMQVAEKEVDKLLPVIQNEIRPSPLWASGLPIATSYWIGKRFRKD